jgi:hypothetical protein
VPPSLEKNPGIGSLLPPGRIFRALAKGVGQSDPFSWTEERCIGLIDGMDFPAPFAPLVRLG